MQPWACVLSVGKASTARSHVRAVWGPWCAPAAFRSLSTPSPTGKAGSTWPCHKNPFCLRHGSGPAWWACALAAPGWPSPVSRSQRWGRRAGCGRLPCHGGGSPAEAQRSRPRRAAARRGRSPRTAHGGHGGGTKAAGPCPAQPPVGGRPWGRGPEAAREKRIGSKAWMQLHAPRNLPLSARRMGHRPYARLVAASPTSPVG
jgi:hypothetical protein